jgi:hypothetical protein
MNKQKSYFLFLRCMHFMNLTGLFGSPVVTGRSQSRVNGALKTATRQKIGKFRDKPISLRNLSTLTTKQTNRANK